MSDFNISPSTAFGVEATGAQQNFVPSVEGAEAHGTQFSAQTAGVYINYSTINIKQQVSAVQVPMPRASGSDPLLMLPVPWVPGA